jgi:hypothetical protein
VKKLVIGCGLGLVLFTVAASAAFYYFVYRPAKTFVGSMAQMGEVAELDAKVTNTQPFTSPTDGALTPEQVTRFVAVQEALHGRMGARATELEAKYKDLEARRGQGDASLTEVAGAYKDIFGVIAEAKRAQVEALNAQRFSLEEYAWVKARFYEAAGVEMTGLDFRELAGALKEGNLDAVKDMASKANEAAKAAAGAATGTTVPAPADAPTSGPATTEPPTTPIGDTPGVGIPDVNKTLVAPHKDAMKKWFVYGMFGL